MSQSFAVGSTAQPVVGAPRVGEQGRLAELDLRRKLQLALAVSWLLDGILQYQPSMFSKAFPQMLAGSSAGNPAVIASPINWSATLITHHLVALNAIFATIQMALGLGIAWRPTVKLALGASVTWALAVWWLGEGLGGVSAGTPARSTALPVRCSSTRCSRSCSGLPTGIPPRRSWPAGLWAGGSPGRCGWRCGRAWRSSPCSPLPGRRGPSAA